MCPASALSPSLPRFPLLALDSCVGEKIQQSMICWFPPYHFLFCFADAVETPRLERHSGHARNMLDKMPQTPGGFYLPKFSGLGLLCDIHSFSFFLLFG
jgi:hypothetical protein